MRTIIGKKALAKREIILWLLALIFLAFFLFFTKGLREQMIENINHLFDFLKFR